MLEKDAARPPVSLDRHDSLARTAAAKPGLISFAGGLPDPALFPKRQLAEAFLVALQAHGRSALQYGWPEGSHDLRHDVAERLRRRGADVDAASVIITSGAQQAVLLALAAAPKKNAVAVDDTSYPGALEAFRAARARLVPLSEAADLYYVMPSVSNPRGQRMSEAERLALLQQVERARGYVLEDDAYDGTSFDGHVSRPLLADAPDRVFHIGTFSKTLCPGLRIGWLVPPRRLARRALRRKQNQDLQANGLTQALLVEYLRDGHFDGLQAKARKRYRRKAQLLQESVARHLPEFAFQPPLGGFSLWLESRLSYADEALLEAAVEQGVSFDPGRLFRFAPGKYLNIRLCFSAVPEQDIDEGVARIARVLTQSRRRKQRSTT